METPSPLKRGGLTPRLRRSGAPFMGIASTMIRIVGPSIQGMPLDAILLPNWPRGLIWINQFIRIRSLSTGNVIAQPKPRTTVTKEDRRIPALPAIKGRTLGILLPLLILLAVAPRRLHDPITGGRR